MQTGTWWVLMQRKNFDLTTSSWSWSKVYLSCCKQIYQNSRLFYQGRYEIIQSSMNEIDKIIFNSIIVTWMKWLTVAWAEADAVELWISKTLTGFVLTLVILPKNLHQKNMSRLSIVFRAAPLYHAPHLEISYPWRQAVQFHDSQSWHEKLSGHCCLHVRNAADPLVPFVLVESFKKKKLHVPLFMDNIILMSWSIWMIRICLIFDGIHLEIDNSWLSWEKRDPKNSNGKTF